VLGRGEIQQVIALVRTLEQLEDIGVLMDVLMA
jgi:hypothetical protein